MKRFGSSAFVKRSSPFVSKSKGKPENSDWNRTILQAEKVVGGNSFRNLAWLFNDDTVSIARHFKKVMTTKHSLVNVIRNIVDSFEIPYGLVVLLFAKAAGLKVDFPEQQKYLTAGILESQYAVAKVTEMLKMCSTIHTQIENSSADEDINYGNKVTLLSGDFLLCECLKELSGLRDQYLVEFMSSGLRDLTNAQYIGPRDDQNRPVPSKPNDDKTDTSYLEDFSSNPIVYPNALGNARGEWVFRNTLNGASLLAKGCSSAMKLGNHPASFQNVAFSFGKNFGLAYRARLDAEEFLSGTTGPFSLVGAPVLFQLQDDPDMFDAIGKCGRDIDDVDYDGIRRGVMSGSALEKTLQLRDEYARASLSVLKSFGENDAQIVLKDLVRLIGGS